jgi:serine/threonine protein kinase/tetratricopeptide (TPR) repeat protein
MSEREIFEAALSIDDPAQRAAYLDRACAGQPGLREHLDGLLSMDAQAGSFLEAPAPAATVDELPITEGPGTVIGPYRLLEPIGEGGFGIVFMAEQHEPIRRKVALKVLKPGMDSRQVIARFEAERQALALMDHLNIAKVLDAGTTDSGRPYFVMDLVKGLPITDFCDQSQLTPRERLELFVHVCQAVQHAHQKGVIHRDLKPSNVLVTLQDGAALVKVIDFGIAKALGQQLTDKTLFTGFAQLVGTPLYMSPEQAALSNVDVDTRSDIYSLGVLLYELLTGTTPFDQERLKAVGYDEMRRIIREEEPPKPSTRVSTLGPAAATVSTQRKSNPKRLSQLFRGELDWIVMKALEKDRNRRYETASAFAADVQSYLADEPVQACPPSVAYRLRKLVRRNRGLVVAAAVVLLTLVTGVIGTTLGLLRAEQARGLAEQQEQQAIAAADQERRAKNRAEQAEREAQDQAAIAQAVNDFVQNALLGQADIGNQPLLLGGPNEGRNPKVTVRELLDRAALGIEGKFPHQELTEAAIRMTIGNAYRALGQYPEAQKHLERALQLRTAQLGPEHAETLYCKHDLAMLDYARGEYRRAESVLLEVLHVRTALLGADHPSTLTCKNNLGLVYQDLGRYDRAEPLFKEVLEGFTAQRGAHHPTTLQGKNNLGLVYQALGKYDRAELLFQEAADGFRAHRGPDHPDTLVSKSNLATLYRRQAKYRQAEQLMLEVVQTRAAQLGADHPSTLSSKNSLAMVFQDLGKYDRAEPLLKETLAASGTKLGAEHLVTLNIKHNLASLYKDQGKYGLAEPLFKEVLDARSAQFGIDHPRTLHSKNGLATLYYAQRKYDRAESLYKEALDARTAKLGADHPDTLESKSNLATLYLDQGKYDRAEPLLQAVLAAYTAKLGADHADTLVCKNNLAMLYLHQRKYDRAEPFLEEVLGVLTAKLGPDHFRTLTIKNNLAGLYFAQGKYDRAEPLFRETLQGSRKKLGLGHPHTEATARNLVVCWDKMGQPAKGEPLLRELADLWKERAGADSLRYAEVLAMLGWNLVRQRHGADAEAVLRGCLAIRQGKEPEAWTTFSAQTLLGEALLLQKKYAEAEPLLVQGYEGMKQRQATMPKEAKPRLIQALEALIRLYDESAQAEKAAAWRRKLQAENPGEKNPGP